MERGPCYSLYRIGWSVDGPREVWRKRPTGVIDVDFLHGGLIKERVRLKHVDLVVRRVGHGHFNLGVSDGGQLDVEASLAAAHGNDCIRIDRGQQRSCGEQNRS